MLRSIHRLGLPSPVDPHQGWVFVVSAASPTACGAENSDSFRFHTAKLLFNHVDEHRNNPDTLGSNVGRPYYQRHMQEGLISGCDLPLIGRSGVVGVLAALKRSERAYSKDEVAFLEQVASQVAIAVENALDYEKAI